MTERASARRSVIGLAKRWLPRLLAIGLLIVALQRAGVEQVWRSVTSADPWSVALSAALVGPFVLVRAARWRVVLRDLGITIGLALASRLYAVGLYFGTITPGQAGDAVKAWYVSRQGASLALSLLSCVLDRLCDVLVLAALATTALVVFWPDERAQWLLGAAVIGGVLVALLFLARPAARRAVLGLPGLRHLWAPLETRVRRQPWGAPLLDSGLHAPTLAVAFGLTLASFAVTMVRVYLLFHAVGVDLPVLTFVAVASVTVFASLVSVGGVGSRDIALITLLTPFGYSEQQAVAAAFLILFITFINLVPGMIVWFAGDGYRAARSAYRVSEVEPAASSGQR